MGDEKPSAPSMDDDIGTGDSTNPDGNRSSSRKSKSPTPAESSLPESNPSNPTPTTDSIDESSSKKRRRKSAVDDSATTPTTAATDTGEPSNLTIENVADHVKRCEQEARAKNRSKPANRSIMAEFGGRPAENGGQQQQGANKSLDVCSSVGSISLDEIVDNFSSMATDGSRQSLYGDGSSSCGGGDDGEMKADKSIAAEAAMANVEDKGPKDDNAAEMESKVEISLYYESQSEAAERPNETIDTTPVKGLDDDGNVVEPELIGEPNEPLLSHWEPEYLPSRRLKQSFMDANSRDSDDSTAERGQISLAASSPTGGQAFETASTTPTDETTRLRGRPPRRSSSTDDEDSMMTSRSRLEEQTGSSSTAANMAVTAENRWPMPPHKWNAVKSLRRREFGTSSTVSPHWFRYYANGALHFVQRLELMYKMEAHEGCVNCLHFNESGTRLASGSDDLNVIIWDWTTKTPLITIESGHRANVFQAKFMPLSGDCHLVTCARDGQVRLAELSVRGVCKSTRKLAQHRGSSHKLTLETDSPHTFLSCGDDAVVFELDLRDPKPNKILMVKERRSRGDGDAKVPLYSIHSNPRNPFYFAVSGRDPYCRIYDKRMFGDGSEPVKKFCPQHLVNSEQKANVTAVMFSHDGSELIGTYNDDDIYLFNTNQTNENEYKHRYRGHRNNATVKGVNFFGPRSEFIVSGSDCGYIYFWEKESETIVQFMPGDEGGVVNVLESHPTSAILATSGLDHDVKIWVPSCEDPKFDVKLLQKLMRQNGTDRERDRRNEPEYLDSQMLWYIMSRMRRAARRTETGDGSDESGADGSDDTENTDDDAGDGPMAVQCRPS